MLSESLLDQPETSLGPVSFLDFTRHNEAVDTRRPGISQAWPTAVGHISSSSLPSNVPTRSPNRPSTKRFFGGRLGVAGWSRLVIFLVVASLEPASIK